LEDAIVDCFQSLILINSCYGGHFINDVAFGGTDSYTDRSGHHVITAGGANQKVFAKDNSSGSYFFDTILEGLSSGEADIGTNGNDGVITTREVMSYLENNSPTNYQIPKLAGMVESDKNNGYFYFYNFKEDFKSGSLKNNLTHFISFGDSVDNKLTRDLPALIDKDGDGIANVIDKCPNQKGLLENGGCPLELSKSGKDLILYKSKEGKFGFKNSLNGDVEIPALYRTANKFIDDLALVSKDGNYGFINSDNREIIPLIYEYLAPFHDGLAAVRLNSKAGFIDKDNEIKIPILYEEAYSFNEGRAIVKKNGLYGFIETSGAIVTPLIFQQLDVYNRQNYIRAKKHGKFGYIDKLGNTRIPFIFDDAIHFSLGRAKVGINQEYFYINSDGVCIENCPVFSNKLISGKILKKGNKNFFGVTVIVKGRSNGTQSDFDGNFALRVSSGDTLVVSAPNYVTKEIKIKYLRPISIEMISE
jgi:hypothetical protein